MLSNDPARQPVLEGPASKATPERFDKVVAALEEGHSIESASAIAGINRRTLQRWMKRALEEDDETGVFSEFLSRCEDARARFEATRVNIIRKAGDNGEWTAAAWWLERVEPARYGRRSVTHHAGPMMPKEFTLTIESPASERLREREGELKALPPMREPIEVAADG